MTRTLVSLHAHPDDESSKGAATVARYAAAGVRCVLVTATGGEAGDILNPALDRPDVKARLADIRRRELLEAAGIIGYDRLELLGFRDSGMPDSAANGHPDALVNQGRDAVLEPLVRLIRTEKPQVLLGYDDHRWYPHPDHLVVHEIGPAAFEAAADPNAFPDAGEPWEISKLYAHASSLRRMEALHAALLDRGLDSPFGPRLERRRSCPGPQPTAQIEVSDYLGVARRALRAHATQVDPEGFWFQVPEEIVRAAYPYDDFTLLRSRVEVAAPETDLFAGLG